MSDDLEGVKNLWIALNAILVAYAIALFIYGKYFRHKDSLSLVINNIIILFLFIQKNIADDNKGMFGRTEDSIRINENKELDEKKINLIDDK